MMNRAIANLFARLVSVLHVAVIGGLALIALRFYSEDANDISFFLMLLGIPKDAFAIVLISIFIGYVLVVGFLSTVISINSNMENINERLQKLVASIEAHNSRS